MIRHIVPLLLAGLAPAVAQLPPRPTPQNESKPVPAKPLPAADVEKLRKQLLELEKELEKRRAGYDAKALEELRTAGQSKDRAMNLWLECKKEVEYLRAGRTATEFSEWRRNEGAKQEGNPKICLQKQLQVQFLALAIQSCHAKTPAQQTELISAALAYCGMLAESCDREEDLAKEVLGSVMAMDFDPEETVTKGNLAESLQETREVRTSLGSSILDTVFAKRYKLEDTLPDSPYSVRNPGNLGDVFERAILTPLRMRKDASGLASAWTRRIELSMRIAKATGEREILQQFMEEQAPLLKWGEARERYRLGLQVPAVESMMAVIKGNPAHANCDEWISELQDLMRSEGITPAEDVAETPPAASDKPAAPAVPSAETASTPVPAGAPADKPAMTDKPVIPEKVPSIKPDLVDPTRSSGAVENPFE